MKTTYIIGVSIQLLSRNLFLTELLFVFQGKGSSNADAGEQTEAG